MAPIKGYSGFSGYAPSYQDYKEPTLEDILKDLAIRNPSKKVIKK